MRRFQLFEFEDQQWFSRRLRQAMQSYLATAYRHTPFPKFWAQCLAPLMGAGRMNALVDLASGAGGPVPLVLEELRRMGFEVTATLTDRFPNPAATPLRYWPEPVDARFIPQALDGTRTMFASFHHFRPHDAHAILRDAFERRVPICVFEATTRGAVLAATLIPLMVLLLTLEIRPLSWIQIVFTYLIPILPVLIFWDGLVSYLRTYSVAELEALTHDLTADYSWQPGKLRAPGVPFGVPFLIGRPNSRQSESSSG